MRGMENTEFLGRSHTHTYSQLIHVELNSLLMSFFYCLSAHWPLPSVPWYTIYTRPNMGVNGIRSGVTQIAVLHREGLFFIFPFCLKVKILQ